MSESAFSPGMASPAALWRTPAPESSQGNARPDNESTPFDRTNKDSRRQFALFRHRHPLQPIGQTSLPSSRQRLDASRTLHRDISLGRCGAPHRRRDPQARIRAARTARPSRTRARKIRGSHSGAPRGSGRAVCRSKRARRRRRERIAPPFCRLPAIVFCLADCVERNSAMRPPSGYSEPIHTCKVSWVLVHSAPWLTKGHRPGIARRAVRGRPTGESPSKEVLCCAGHSRFSSLLS
jgi:hypothetical protein